MDQEPAAVRDRYGRHPFGQSLLLARRLVEVGVPVVQANMGRVQNWDTHSDNFGKLRDRLLPPLDQAVAALLDDLGTSGLLEETLVVLLGEFGRTPRISIQRGQTSPGRDHWGPCFSGLFAGAGVRGGQVIGRSDPIGAYPATTPYTPDDVGASIYHALGVDATAEVSDRQGRPVRLNGGAVIEGRRLIGADRDRRSISPGHGDLMSANQPDDNPITRRTALQSALVVGGAAALAGSANASQAQPAQADARRASPRRYTMKKSINLWAFPYPERMTLRECLQLAKSAGFDGIELNYDLDDDLSPRASAKDLRGIRAMADKIGIAISGLCSFLFWPYPLSSNDSQKRARGLELAGRMVEAAHELGTENLLVVPGAVHIPWRTDHEPVANDVCDRRARDAVTRLLPQAEKARVHLNIENIFFNGYLMTPAEMNAFVDSFQSKYVRVHFDTGNIMLYQFPEHWIAQLGNRIKNTHFKEFTKKGTDSSLESFRPLLDGTTNWPAVMEALDKIGYRDFLTFEYFHPYPHYPEALVYQTADALDRMLGRK